MIFSNKEFFYFYSMAMQFCPICMEDKHDIVITPCNHVFCKPCLAKWKNKNPTCPCCRAPLAGAKFDWLHAVHLFASGATVAALLYIMGSDGAMRNLENVVVVLHVFVNAVAVNLDLIHYLVDSR